MARLIYSAITSFDGYTVDANGSFDWAAPDEQVHAFVNELERQVGTYLYGRRMYETMKVWQTTHDDPDPVAVTDDYAQIWQAADKIVYSTSLDAVETPRTRLERAFDPAAVRELKDAADRDITVGGPTLAAHALRAGLVDELQQFLTPVAVGGGTRFLPAGARFGLELADERRFDNGVVFLQYRVTDSTAL
jgi:dihydrofolate reductase